MENTSGPIKPFLSGKMPKDKYTDVNELVKDLVKILAIDADSITVNLVALSDLKGEKGDKGARGAQGKKGDTGGPGLTGPAGPPLAWRDQWVITTPYHINDLVLNNNIIYIAVTEHTSAAASEPGVGVDEADNWDEFINITALDMSIQTFQVLADGATVTWPAATAKVAMNATVTLGGDRTLAMTGWTSGMYGRLKVVQDGTGTRLLTLPAGSLEAGGSLVLSVAPAAIDILNVVYDGTNFFWRLEAAYA